MAAITATRDTERSGPLIVTARYAEQRRLAKELGADIVCTPTKLPRWVRSTTKSMVLGDQLTSGFRHVVDCVGSSESLKQALRVVAPGGEVLLVGMPGNVSLELTSLWHREVAIRGCYAVHPQRLHGGHRDRPPLRPRPAASRPPIHSTTTRTRSAHAASAGRRGAVKVAFDMRESGMLMPRPGFVLEVDRSTPPIMFWRGENFSLEKLPAGRSRVIYPPEPLEAIEDIDGAIREALLNPHDQDPLPAQLFPGMKLTIAFDDVSLPLPKMRTPDNRQRIIEAVLDLAADAGVDDVHIIAALGLHRRMHEYELRHALGDRIYDAFHPRGTLYQHDAEDLDNLTVHRHDAGGRGVGDQQARRRQRPHRLRQHQLGGDGRRMEEHHHRPGQLPQPQLPPQPGDAAEHPQPDGPPQERAAQERLAARQGACATTGRRCSRSSRR